MCAVTRAEPLTLRALEQDVDTHPVGPGQLALSRLLTPRPDSSHLGEHHCWGAAVGQGCQRKEGRQLVSQRQGT